MSNIISFCDTIALKDLSMSNGGTDVFINVLALSGAVIAQTESEKRLIVYLSERDQKFIGGGCVGFSIVEMPWSKGTFAEDKRFLLSVIQGARDKVGWEILPYLPEERIISQYLDTFACLVQRMTIDDIQKDTLAQWLAEAGKDDPVLCGFPRCPLHNTFLTCFGCQICNST